MNLSDSILIARACANGAKMPPNVKQQPTKPGPTTMPVPFNPGPQQAPRDYPMPVEAVAIVRDVERKWAVLRLTLEDGLVVKTEVIERNVALDIVQDRARREVRLLR